MKIAIDITNKCDLNCPYCYAMKNYKNKWNTQDLTLINFSKIINLINSKNKISILGGEPFLHPNIKSFIELLNKKKFNEVFILTNFLQNNIIYENILKNTNIKLRISFHWDLIKDKKSFFKKIKKLNIQSIIHIMITKNSLKELNLFKDEILKLNQTIYCDFIIDNKSWLNEYNGFYDIYKSNILDKELKDKFISAINLDILPQYKIIDIDNNFTKKIFCVQDLININIYGDCEILCKDENFNCFKEPLKLKKISSSVEKLSRCTKEFCVCLDALESKKRIINEN